MLRELRKKYIKDVKKLDEILDNVRCSKYYIENNFTDIKLFKYLRYLRKNGADLNTFFDSDIKVIDRSRKKNVFKMALFFFTIILLSQGYFCLQRKCFCLDVFFLRHYFYFVLTLFFRGNFMVTF